MQDKGTFYHPQQGVGMTAVGSNGLKPVGGVGGAVNWSGIMAGFLFSMSFGVAPQS